MRMFEKHFFGPNKNKNINKTKTAHRIKWIIMIMYKGKTKHKWKQIFRIFHCDENDDKNYAHFKLDFNCYFLNLNSECCSNEFWFDTSKIELSKNHFINSLSCRCCTMSETLPNNGFCIFISICKKIFGFLESCHANTYFVVLFLKSPFFIFFFIFFFFIFTLCHCVNDNRMITS